MGKTIFVCSEAASLGPNMSCIEDALQIGRGYGIGMILAYQSLGFLKVCFPKDGGQVVLSNAAQIYFAINDNDTAEEVSRRLGDHTVVTESGGQGWGRSWQTSISKHHGGTTHSNNGNANWNQVSRRLLKPEEVMGLDERIAITFAQGGVPPIMSRLERYYETKPERLQAIKAIFGTLATLALATADAIMTTIFLQRVTL